MQRKKLFIRVIFLTVCFLVMTGAARAQDEEPATREITSLDFQKKRPQPVSGSVQGSANPGQKSSTKPTNKSSVIVNPKRRYKLVKRTPRKKLTKQTVNSNTGSNKNKLKPSLKIEELGVTFWRLRSPEADETDAATFPVKIDKKVERWTAERVASTTRFRAGDRVRFTIEASRSGFLYIVNREFYTDGTSGEANIIFPTQRTRGGDNSVTAGSLIDIPAASDAFPYFNVTTTRENYAGEELLVIISPVKLPLEIGLRAQSITRDTVQKWLDDWGATVDIYDAEDGEGIAYTKIEATTATTASRSLTQEEPLPQTIYRVKIREGEPLIVPFQMQADIP
jgi:Domain of unknown function (DUF4384)